MARGIAPMFDRLRTGLARAAATVLGQDTFTRLLMPDQLGMLGGPRMGAAAVLKAYNELPWLRAIFGKIQFDVAHTVWTLDAGVTTEGKYMRNRTLQRAVGDTRRKLMLQARAQGTVKRIENHPAIKLLEDGNAWFSGGTTVGLTQLHLDLIGEGAWFLELNKYGMPLSATPFPPTWIVERPTETWPYYRVMGPWRTVDIPREQIMFIYHPDPSNPFTRGVGFGQAMADDLETDSFAAKYTRDWFKWKAIPPVLISGLGVDLNEMERVEQKWLQKTQGRGRGWLPHFMSKDVKVHQLSQAFGQQDLGPLRRFERDTIRQIVGAPPEIFGITESSNRATISAAQFIYSKHVLVPRLEFIRAELQRNLMGRYDDRLILDYVSPVVEDREFQLEVMKAQPHAFYQDEWRALAAHDPLESDDGKVHMVDFKLRPVRTLREVAEQAPPGAGGEPNPDAPTPRPVAPLADILPGALTPAEDDDDEEGGTEETAGKALGRR